MAVDVQAVFAGFRVGKRPFPAFSKTKKAARDAVIRWGGARWADASLKLNLWKKLSEEGERASLSALECSLAPTLLFADLDEGHPKLLPRRDIFAAVLREIEAKPRVTLRSGMVRSFFMHYPSDSPDLPWIAGQMKRLAEELPQSYWLTESGAFEPDGASVFVERVLAEPDVLLQSAIAEMGEDLILPNSLFAAQVWRRRLPLYGRFIAESYHSERKCLEVLRWIERDSMGESGRLLIPEAFHEFSQAVLSFFSRSFNAEEIPSEAIQKAVYGLFLKLLGDPKDGGWERLDADLKNLFKRWSVGRALNEAFDYVEECCRMNFQAVYQWRPRKYFWQRYWNAGRVLGCRLYFPRRLLTREVRNNPPRNVPVGELLDRNRGVLILIALGERVS